MVLKFLLHVSVINYHQGAYCICIAKVIIVKQSVKIRGYGINLAVWLHIYPVLVGVCTVGHAEYTAYCTHTNKDWIDMHSAWCTVNTPTRTG